MQLRAGDWVRVRSKEEILATLDKKGRLGGLPFMPEMFRYCGERVRVSASAHKTCGPIDGRYLALETTDLVHLGWRCDGQAHGGCQNGCMIFWHRAWLEPEDSDQSTVAPPKARGCAESDLVAAARLPYRDGQARYACQATALKDYARPLKWWDARVYWKSYRTRNQSLRELIAGISFMLYCKIAGPYGQRFGARPLYDAFQKWRGGRPFPRRQGLVPTGTKTPVVTHRLKEGDLVRVKSHEEILETLTQEGMNRGMSFDAEMVPFCGHVYRVRAMVDRFVDEETGVMRHMKTPACILENVYCRSFYSGRRTFCSRAYFVWWREAWLEPLADDESAKVRHEIEAGEKVPVECPAAARSRHAA